MSGPTYLKIGADVSDVTAQLAVAKAAFSATNAELRSMAQQMLAAGSGAGEELKAGLAAAATAAVQAKADVAALNAELKSTMPASGGIAGLEGSFKKLLQPIADVKSALTGMAEAAAAIFAVDRIASWDEQIAEAGAHMGHLAQQIGVSIEEMSGLSGAFSLMGMGSDQAATMIERLEKNLVAAENGSKIQVAAFKDLGISATELKDLSIDEVLNRMADAFQATADGPEKTAIAIALMGRAGAEMIPFLDQGRAGLEEFKQRAEDTGTVLTGPMVAGMEKTTEGSYECH